MKRSLVILAIGLLSIFGMAQANYDSLFSEWNNETRHDTARLIALFNFYQGKHMYTNVDSAIVYAKLHWSFAKERGLTAYMAGGKNAIGQCHMIMGHPDTAIAYFAEAIALFKEGGDMAGAAGSYSNTGMVLSGLGRGEEALEQYEIAIELYKKYGEPGSTLNPLNNKGVVYLNLGDYDRAIPVFEEVIEAASQKKVGSNAHKGGYVNLGFCYASKGDHARAIDNYNECIKLIDEYGGGQVDIYVYNFLGSSYSTLGESENALKYLWKAFGEADTLGDKVSMSQALLSIGGLHQDEGENLEARNMYERALALVLEAQNYSSIVQPLGKLAKLDLEEGKLDSAEARFTRVLKIAWDQGEIDQQAIGLLGLGDVSIQRGNYGKAIELLTEARRIGFEIGAMNTIQGAAEGLAKAYKETGQSKLALERHEEFILYRDSIQSDENKRAAIRQEFRYSYEKQALADSLDFAQKEAIKDLEIAKQKSNSAKQRIGLAATGGGLMLLILLALSIRRGKKRSDELLHNILPEEVATELKQRGKVGSKRIESVTVLFTDFKGFTAMAEQLSPKELVEDLNLCFSEFDRIMEKYGIEKIKTIGDAYMAAGGLPTPNTTHATDVIKAALEMRDFVEAGKAKKVEQGLPYFEIRIGVHTGPVVAGIVGVKKFQYDIWGDTVNTTSRMESSGEVGQVNISQATYELVKDNSELDFRSRGKVAAKGKGELEMYFVETT